MSCAGLIWILRRAPLPVRLDPAERGKQPCSVPWLCSIIQTREVITIDGVIINFPMNPKDKIVAPWPHLTVVFQSLFLWPHLTLRENILLPARKHNPEGM
jgi:ABC-type arginine transport system ATPase subunit